MPSATAIMITALVAGVKKCLTASLSRIRIVPDGIYTFSVLPKTEPFLRAFGSFCIRVRDTKQRKPTNIAVMMTAKCRMSAAFSLRNAGATSDVSTLIVLFIMWASTQLQIEPVFMKTYPNTIPPMNV